MSVEPISDQLATEMVDALGDVYGVHAGHRATHAKGTLCAATFTATPEAAARSRAAHFQGAPIRAHVRFSNGSGVPDAHDGARDGRGMSVKLYLPDGSTTDVVALTLPVFFVRTPADFLELTRARRPDPATGKPDLARVGAFVAAHPESMAAMQLSLAAAPPASYLGLVYHAIHAFELVDRDGSGRYVRYRWEPEEPREPLAKEEARARHPDYLRAELVDRLAVGPAAFRLVLALAEPGDPVDDPTAAWPQERETVVAGRLEVTGIATDRERDGDVLVFDPTRVTDGVACSPDPILHARSRAYSVSLERRSGVPRPA